ncbi:MAG: hypothetical protein AABW88_05270 [Nanoarchaeota archaeon]
MADFGMPYYTPMDQSYHREIQNADRRSDIEKEPLFPIHLIGTTVPEADASGRNRNIVEGVDAAIRGGAGNIQLVMSGVGQQAAMGPASGPKGYGEDVREAIREIQKASGARITGLELPTSVSNLSGFSQQGFSEEQKKMALDEVRDSIKFIGDIAGGGGVDILSWEFPRNFSESTWWAKEKDSKGKALFEQRGEEHPAIVDSENGRIQMFSPKEKYYLYKQKGTDKKSDDPEEWNWEDFRKLAEQRTKETGKLVRAEQVWVKDYLQEQQEKQIRQNKNQIEMYKLESQDMIDRYTQTMQSKDMPDSEKKKYQDRIDSYNQRLDDMKIQEKQIVTEERKLKDLETKYVTIDEYGFKQATDSYAQAGLWAMQESQKNQYVQRGKGSIHVGPEMGWPQYYGSHPKEWVDLILQSREEMKRKLVQEEHIAPKEAEKMARDHIKGEVDTSHLGMWLQNFKTELPWDERVTEFKKWYKDQMEYLAKVNKEHDIIGGIQVVDSASGAHGHLPAGQGILGKDIYEYMKILKEKGGYKGELISEGHEEEKFGQGRILTQAWSTFGSPISTGGYMHGRATPQFRDIRQNYAQIAYGTTGIFQSYVPSNDFQLWSQVPLE